MLVKCHDAPQRQRQRQQRSTSSVVTMTPERGRIIIDFTASTSTSHVGAAPCVSPHLVAPYGIKGPRLETFSKSLIFDSDSSGASHDELSKTFFFLQLSDDLVRKHKNVFFLTKQTDVVLLV